MADENREERDRLIAELKAMGESGEEVDSSWEDDLPLLPKVPSDKEVVATMIPSRKSGLGDGEN